jgi:phospholipid/cholesterol/gamma-HCH transport system substrate-binding protein
MGHELSATVDLDPTGDWEPGTRVTVFPARGCGECDWCRAGFPRYCLTPPYGEWGGYAEYTVFPSRNLIRLPDALDDRTAALTEPFGVGLRAVDLAAPKEGDLAYVSGLGPIGLFAAAGLVAAGTQEDTSGSTYYNASFGRAGQGLDPGKSDVKIRGITVGTVDRIRLDRDGRVTVRLRVEKGVRVPRSTAARIEPVSVFGPKDVLLDLGAGEGTGPYLADGGRIAQTRDPQELSDTAWPAYRLTKAINPDEVTTIIHTFGAGLSGEGPALRRTLDNGAKVIDAAHRNRAVIQQLISDLNGVSGTFAVRGDTITGISRDFNRLSPVVSGRPDKVSQLLDQSSELTGKVGTSLRGHGANLGKLIDDSADLAHVLAVRQRYIPVLLDNLNGFFSLLSQIIRVPGPKGTLLAQAVDTLPLDLCQTFVDVCPATPTKTSFDQPVKTVVQR